MTYEKPAIKKLNIKTASSGGTTFLIEVAPSTTSA